MKIPETHCKCSFTFMMSLKRLLHFHLQYDFWVWNQTFFSFLGSEFILKSIFIKMISDNSFTVHYVHNYFRNHFKFITVFFRTNVWVHWFHKVNVLKCIMVYLFINIYPKCDAILKSLIFISFILKIKIILH